MERFYVDKLAHLVESLDWMIRNAEATPDQIALVPSQVMNNLAETEVDFVMAGLAASASGLGRLLLALSRPSVTWMGMLRYADYLKTALKDELRGRCFLHLDIGEAGTSRIR